MANKNEGPLPTSGESERVRSAGLVVQRLYTTEGIHPYDEVKWERRDVVQTNWRTGEAVFEQRGVEFPQFWSMNASTIVTTKYFRGAHGTEQREWSLKQLIDRVVLTYVNAGLSNDYFATEADAEIFEHEMTWMLLHQVFAFNSPVWFNVGTSSSQQISACFILAVDDTMESILNWYTEEGMIFKGGSGSGVNLSRIRSSKELLKSSGGNASGPVSFMRGADASAGTIKSGGSTRRAAKMCIMDVDHPDIEEFIETKVREEEKIRVLRDAGFDMDLGGKDIMSVQYQNANNSVRVTDTFMRAVRDGGTFPLTARTDGSIVDSVEAKALFRSMAEAAWKCADPGIQYDDTINDWHTNPETGRITASNPCSEYLSIDNSSCNLASLNLMKFLRDDGTFDSIAFVRAAELIITAMDISICFGDFPTQKIGENTRAYRQLGLGFANLGALLMALGKPYDSDEGRAAAAAITSLMTGTAYRRSAELAGIVGAYEGFARNKDAHTRVMRKHAAANDALRNIVPFDTDIRAAADIEWKKCLDIGAANGWRNAQATVQAPTGTISFFMDCDTTGIEPDFALVKFKKLVSGDSLKIVNTTVPVALRRLGYTEETVEAIVEHIAEHGNVINAPGLRPEHYPVFDCAVGERSISPMGHVHMMAAMQPFISGALSKCVVGSTLIATGDGLVRIGTMYDGEEEDTFRNEIVEVASINGTQKTDAFYYGGIRPVRKVTLRSGHTVTGTLPHRLLTADPSGGLLWKNLGEIEPGDQVAVKYGDDLWSSVPADLAFAAEQIMPAHGSQKSIRVPTQMSNDLAFLLGVYASEGHTTQTTHTVTITNPTMPLLEEVQRIWRSEFNLDAKIRTYDGKCPAVVVSSKAMVEFLAALGCGSRAPEKRIPDAILRSPRSMVLRFLDGLALDSYFTLPQSGAGKWAICLDSGGMLDDLQAVLTNLGVVHSRATKHNKEYDKDFDEVNVMGDSAQMIASLLTFWEPHKAERAQRALSAAPARHNTADIVPGITGSTLYNILADSLTDISTAGKIRQEFHYLKDSRTTAVTRRSVARVAAVVGAGVPEWLATVMNDGLHFSAVQSIEDAGEQPVYDLSVPGTHAFVGNGITNHNTVNLPASATVEDVEEVYWQGWKLGLKALAVYRDNSKVGQPLSDSKAKDKEEEEPVRPVRRRLPRQRPSKTYSFTVADAEGYLTAGSYPDGGLGEIFLKLGKQGSTLAGVMDAFSIAVSIALQHGVPLEAYVEKFVNMRFDPAGLTDDPDIRLTQSVIDYIFRRLAIDHLPFDERTELGILTAAERAQALDTGTYDDAPAISADLDPKSEPVGPVTLRPTTQAADGPMCMTCGTSMRRAGSCYACESCGNTSGCS